MQTPGPPPPGESDTLWQSVESATAAQAAHQPALAFPSVPGYEIVGVLGRGGMGVVLKARQVALDRVVALKVVLSGEYASEQERRRLRGEAQAAARLSHPNIVQVYEVGQTALGAPYLAMEYCPGGSLQQRLDGTPWHPEQAARLLITLAGAVGAAHEAKVIHRDLKPGNVLLTEDGSVKLSDFGLARRLDGDTLTASGVVAGTAAYMAPEQARGQSSIMGPATDVYGLGAILYELLTGKAPFKADTFADSLLGVLHERPVPPHSVNPATPPALEAICLSCLQKDPARRPPSAAALAAQLEDWLRCSPAPAPRPRWRRLVAALLVVLALGAAGLGVVLGRHLFVSTPPGGPGTTGSGTGGTPLVVPDRNLYGLLVGVGDVDNPTPSSDALALYRALRAQQGTGYRIADPPWLLDREATRGAILDGLRKQVGLARSGDLLVVYLAGDGFNRDGAGGGFLFGCAGLDPKRPDATGVRGVEILEILAGNPRCRACVVVDTNAAGALVEDLAQVRFEPGAEPILLLGCQGTEAAHVRAETQRGVVTQAVLEALRPPVRDEKNPADANGDGTLDASELGAYLSKRVRELVGRGKGPDGRVRQQTPVVRLPEGPPEPLFSLRPPVPDTDTPELEEPGK